MQTQTYEMTALALRWWFLALLAVIFLRLAFSTLRERIRQPEQIEKAAGFTIGLLEVVYPENSRLCGRRFPLERENRVGSSGVCEARVRSRGVRGVHCVIARQNGRTLLSPSGAGLYLNGSAVRQPVVLDDGDFLGMGGLLLRVRLNDLTDGVRRPREYDRRLSHRCVESDDYDEIYAEYMGFFDGDGQENYDGDYGYGEEDAPFDEDEYDEEYDGGYDDEYDDEQDDGLYSEYLDEPQTPANRQKRDGGGRR